MPPGPPSGPAPAPFAYPPTRRKFTYKPDEKAYNQLKHPADFPKWYEETLATARAQGLADLFNPTFRPNIYTPEDAEAWDGKQAFMYMVLQKKVHTPLGKQIVRKARYTWNAQEVIAKLVNDAQTSTHAVLSGRKLLERLTSIRFDPGSGKSAVGFIVKYQEMVELYNDQQTSPSMQLSEPLVKTLLQSAVSSVTILRATADREHEQIIQGGRAFTFEQYCDALKAVATRYDEPRTGRRSANVANLEYEEEWSDDEDGDSNTGQAQSGDAISILINELKRRMPGSSMNKDTWNSLSTDGQSTWDKLSDTDKAKILKYAAQRAGKPTRLANVHQQETMDEDAAQVQDDINEVITDSVNEESEEVQRGITSINNAIAIARGKAHPGDPRRMLGSLTPSKKTTQVKTVQWGPNGDIDDSDDSIANVDDDLLDSYWDSESDEDFP